MASQSSSKRWPEDAIDSLLPLEDLPGLPLGYHLPAAECSERPIGFMDHSKERKTSGDTDAGAPIYYTGDEHLATFAPTGAGKSTGCVIPALLAHDGPCVVIDIKGELHAVTARYRAERFGRPQVHLLLPDKPEDARDSLNPLDCFELEECGDTDDLARQLADFIAQDTSSRDKFWDITPKALLSGVICAIRSAFPKSDRRLSKIRELFAGGDFEYQVAVLLDTKPDMSREARAELLIFLDMPAKETRPSVSASTQHHVNLFGLDTVRAVTDTSSFDLNEVSDGNCDVFITIAPHKLHSHSRLLRLWVGTLVHAIITRRARPAKQTLFILDEVAQLGYMPLLESAITLMRGYGLSVWTFWQDLDQLKNLYPSWRTLLNNTSVIQAFGARNHWVASQYADLAGPGISSEEIIAMPRENALLMMNGKSSIVRRMNYLTDPLFRGRFDPNPYFGGEWPAQQTPPFKRRARRGRSK